MTGSTLFTDAMALSPPSGDGVYEGLLNEHWTIGPKVHGGAMLALCANAARTEFASGPDGNDVEPIAVSGELPVGAGSGPDAGGHRGSQTWSAGQPDRRGAQPGGVGPPCAPPSPWAPPNITCRRCCRSTR